MSPQARKRDLDAIRTEDNSGQLETSETQRRNIKKSRKLSSAPQVQVKPELQRDDQGVEFWEISKNRRVNVTEFAGQNMINIREYYEKDGKTLPGKKGISLTVPQFSALVSSLPDIHRTLKDKGEHVSLPQFEESGIASQSASVMEEKDEQSSDQKSAGKRNFDATSDEDEE